MSALNRLPLYQDLYLIAHDQAGKPLINQPSLSLGPAGAVLLDLALTCRLDITHGRLAVYDLNPIGDMVAAGVLTRVTRRRMGVMSQTRYPPTDVAPVVRARSGVHNAVEAVEQPDARCAALCGLVGVLRVEAALHLAQPSGQLVGRLRSIAREYPRPVNEVIGVVETLISEAAVALYR
ncbi:GPP34 family phosphoprotein [Microtetraspora sp. AC03309]|uniref:GOLPH3/VPS74 family protein n=1 Tax=Microtetraspora sp. AC03309 TaxID=2779376 RepID=UPI001E4D074D|nr:GPP34 family phosphoprotein [Microtetraspora sp. AC03309]MCC5575176.1 GPP34 family phosphoprotein [Microtetraspora sp. AC03309]